MRTMTIETTGNIPAVEPMFLAQASGLEYQRQGESICAASVLAEEESPSKRLEPASMLTGVIGADQAGSETVNEIAADHHTFDQRALGEEGLTESTGEMWVASNGGYIVRYRLSSKAGADYFGEGIEGTLTMEYEISEVNQPLALDLPDDCPPGFVDTPLMENAQGVEKYPGMTLFSTPSDLKAVTDFYEKILTESGWQANGDPAVTEEAAILQFSRDALHLSIVAGKNDTGTEVRLMIVQPTELNFQLP